MKNVTSFTKLPIPWETKCYSHGRTAANQNIPNILMSFYLMLVILGLDSAAVVVYLQFRVRCNCIIFCNLLSPYYKWLTIKLGARICGPSRNDKRDAIYLKVIFSPNGS